MEHELPDPPLSPEQSDLCARLSSTQLAAIDAALLSHCSAVWRKAAFVVGSALGDVRLPGIPDLFFAQRLKEHVAHGRLEAFGDFSCMRYFEVRFPIGTAANAA